MDQQIQAIKTKPKLRIVPTGNGNTCNGCDLYKGPGTRNHCKPFTQNVAPCFVMTGAGADYFHVKLVGRHVSTR